MVEIYDNWERLVRATLDREELRQIAQRTTSDLSVVSASSSFNLASPSRSASSINLLSLLVGETFNHHQILKTTDYSSSSNLIKHTPLEYLLNSPQVGAVAQNLLEALAVAFHEESKYVTQFPTQFRKLDEQLRYVRSFVADLSLLKHKREVVKTALAALQELVYEADDLIVDCQILEDYRKMKGSSSFPLSLSEMSFPYETGKKLTEINSQIKRVCEILISYYNPIAGHPNTRNNREYKRCREVEVFDASEIVWPTKDTATIRNWILTQNEPLLRIGIVGMGGMGKTTFAKIIYRDVNLTKRFQEKIWVSVSQPVNEVEIMKSTLNQLNEDGRWSSKGDMLNRIYDLLSDKTYLIVLDDVWSIDDGWWGRISVGFPMAEGTNNCIIITSRIKKVVKIMGVLETKVHEPKLLNDEESWALFCNVAHISPNGEETPKLVEEGKEVVEKCGGLPLAIMTLGGLLSLVDKTYLEWKRISYSFHEMMTSLEGSGSKGYESVIASLLLSYDELPARLKQCILCFSIYPEDYEIDVDQLIRWWIGEGFVHGKSTETATESALNCLSELISRCLVEVVQRKNFDGSSTPARNVELAKVKSLRVLDLSHVKLDSISVKDLWYWITSLKRLAYLNLGHVAKLIQVPSTIGKLWGLQILILGGCKDLEKLPTSISNLPRLTILDVSNCPRLQCLPQGLSGLSNLQELYGFKIAGPANVAGSHLRELKALTELRVLHMEITEESTIQDDELMVLAHLEKLRVLSVNAGDCEDWDIVRKLNKLSPPPFIAELYLKHYFGKTTPRWLNPKSLQQLQYLCIENSDLNKMNNDFWGDEEIKWQVEGLCLKFCPRLEVEWQELKAVMPRIRYFEINNCYSLVSFPCETWGVGLWYKEEK
ncbi:hypothetical protein ACH5RR_029018 [Cinchona calisaya]|uniref:Disease resistance RPP13-like protein 4 n=1 Tax=Cinchona calisaya TaxID=153742 RepID=A0ABD2YTQ6_9GENT